MSDKFQNTAWIDYNTAKDSTIYKEGYLLEKDIYRYGYITVCYFKEKGKFRRKEGTVAKIVGRDTLSITLMDGGAIYEGNWKLINKNNIICNYKMISSKLLLTEEELREKLSKIYTDTIFIRNSMISLNDSTHFLPLHTNVID